MLCCISLIIEKKRRRCDDERCCLCCKQPPSASRLLLQNYRGVRMLSKHVKILDLTTIRVDDVIPVETMGLFVRRMCMQTSILASPLQGPSNSNPRKRRRAPTRLVPNKCLTTQRPNNETLRRVPLIQTIAMKNCSHIRMGLKQSLGG